jgi:hypothetical protein
MQLIVEEIWKFSMTKIYNIFSDIMHRVMGAVPFWRECSIATARRLREKNAAHTI